MKLTVIGNCGGSMVRLGSLVNAQGSVMETPRLALLTVAGSIPHLTRSVLDRAFPDPQLLMVPLSTCLHLENGIRAQNAGLTAFCGGRTQDAWVMTIDNPARCTPDGHFETEKVPLWTRHGKILISSDRYMDIMSLMKVDACCVLADTRTHPRSGRKRLARAAERSVNTLDACVQHRHKVSSALLGVITGWGSKEAVFRSTSAVKHRRELRGVMLAGLATTEEAALLPPSHLKEQVRHVTSALDPTLVRMAPGAFSPALAVSLLDAGCDVLDSSVAARLADTGHAMVFPLTHQHAHTDCILNMNLPRYKEDFTPLVSGCTCVCCETHTRAYVHHLINTRELLAPLLLTLHNLHHYSRMFAEIRTSIADGSFPRYRDFIVSQHDRWTRQYPQTEPAPVKEAELEADACKRVKTNTQMQLLVL